jgi:hypothetical protein
MHLQVAHHHAFRLVGGFLAIRSTIPTRIRVPYLAIEALSVASWPTTAGEDKRQFHWWVKWIWHWESVKSSRSAFVACPAIQPR